MMNNTEIIKVIHDIFTRDDIDACYIFGSFLTSRFTEQSDIDIAIVGNIELEDRLYRDYGILTNARKLNSSETEKLMSELKLGTDLGVIPELNDFKVKKIMLYSKPANLQKYCGRIMEEEEQEIERAKVIKKIISE